MVDAASATDPAGLAAITTSLRKAIGNSGEHDAPSLRRSGGECGTSGNTARLAGFGTGDRRKITDEAARIRAGGKPTLVRGIVEAVEDAALNATVAQMNVAVQAISDGASASPTATPWRCAASVVTAATRAAPPRPSARAEGTPGRSARPCTR